MTFENIDIWCGLASMVWCTALGSCIGVWPLRLRRSRVRGALMSVILEKRSSGVAWVIINRPEVLNALDFAAKERLAAIWQELADDKLVRAIVLTGAGEKAFCAGSDIKEIDRAGHMVSTDTLLRAIPGVGIPLFKPVIGALHGYCIGMGMTL